MHRLLRPRQSAQGSRTRVCPLAPPGVDLRGLGRALLPLGAPLAGVGRGPVEPQLGPPIPVHFRLRAWHSAHALVARSRLMGVDDAVVGGYEGGGGGYEGGYPFVDICQSGGWFGSRSGSESTSSGPSSSGGWRRRGLSVASPSSKQSTCLRIHRRHASPGRVATHGVRLRRHSVHGGGTAGRLRLRDVTCVWAGRNATGTGMYTYDTPLCVNVG